MEVFKINENFNIEVGQKIFKARKQLNMSRADLGKKVNLHESTVKRYEDGQIKSLDIDKMKEFAKALDIDPTYLMGWSNNSNNVKTIDSFAIYSSHKQDTLSKHIIELCKSLNREGKKEALKRIEELTYIPKYINKVDNQIDTIAAHNDYVSEEEIYKIKEDIEDMKNW